MESTTQVVHGFMHIAMHGHWRSIVEEQFKLMRSSGLYAKLRRLFVGLLGPNRSAFDLHDPKIEVIYHDRDFARFEFPTIQFLHRFCQSQPGLIFYLHTKGVFNNTPCTRDWRRYMQHFVIERHDECIKALADSDVCGVDWLRLPWPHFSGNYWWAKADYVRKLQDPEALPVIGLLDHGRRHNAERWIGTGAGVRATSLFSSRADLYAQRFPPSRYTTAEAWDADDASRPARLNPGLTALDIFPHDEGRLIVELPRRKAETCDSNGLGAWYKPIERLNAFHE